MTERAAMRPLGTFLRSTVAHLQAAAGRTRDRASGTPGRTGSGADVTVRPAFARLRVVLVRVLAVLLLPVSTLISSPTAAQTTAPGTLINNVAQATFVRGNTATAVASNSVATMVVPPSSRSTIQLLRTATGPVIPVSGSGSTPPEVSGPTLCLGSSGMQTLPNPVLIGGASIDPAQPRVFNDTSSYHGGEPVFVRVVD